jgi:uncharacterized protein (DUF488 family)
MPAVPIDPTADSAGEEPPAAKPRAVSARLLTVGYEQHRTHASLTEALRAAGVERLLDVRELPLSRRRGFSKRALAAALGAAGIHYEHERALGNPKPLRDLYRSGRQREGEAGYLAHVRNGSAWAVHELARTLTETTTCLMCWEHDHRTCHRDVIVSELRRLVPGLQVEHL